MTRRRAFTVAGQGLGGIAGAAIVLPAVGFAVAPDLRARQGAWEAVGPIDDFVADTYRQVVFTDRRRASARPARPPPTSARAPPTSTDEEPGRVHRDLHPLRPPRLPGPLRRGRRQLHLPLPRRRLRLPGQGDRRPAGAPARPLPDPGPRAARSRSAPATASPRSSSRSAPATPASSPAASGNTSTRRGPRLPAAADGDRRCRKLPLPTSRSSAPRPSRADGRTAPAAADGARRPPAERAKEAAADVVGWVDERTGATGFLTGMLYRKVPKGTNWFYTLGSATLFAFIVQASPASSWRCTTRPRRPRPTLDRPHHQRRLPRRVRARHAQVGRDA